MQGPSFNYKSVRSDSNLEQLRSSLKLASHLSARTDPTNHADRFEDLTGKLGPKCLIDCLGTTSGSGAGLLGLSLCTRAQSRSGEFVVVDTSGTFFPPAAIAWSVDARNLLVVRPDSNRAGIAAAELALRSPAVSVVWATLDYIDPKSFRRLLLATESANAFGVLVRSAAHCADPSWADAQLLCEPVATVETKEDQRLVRVTQTRNRHGPLAGSALISMNWRTGEIQAVGDQNESQNFSKNSLPLATRLASATLPPRAS